jgi:hypothetical protein
MLQNNDDSRHDQTYCILQQELPRHFVVGGRLIQRTDPPAFITGQSDAVDELPTCRLAVQVYRTLKPEYSHDPLF